MNSPAQIQQQLDDLYGRHRDLDPSLSVAVEERELLRRLIIEYGEAVEGGCDTGAVSESRRKQTAELVQRPVFICGYMKTGTTLVLQMLDRHPELVVFQGDSYSMDTLRRTASLLDYTQQMRERSFYRLVAPAGIETPNWLFGREPGPYASYLTHFRELSAAVKGPGDVMAARVAAHYWADPAASGTAHCWVEKTPGNEQWVDEILGLFPGARFLHIVRCPLETLASVKRMARKSGWDWNVDAYLEAMAESLNRARDNCHELGKDRYHILNYHDLVADPAAIMRRVAGFLGIRWDEGLVQPTIGGRPAKASTMFQERKVEGSILNAPSPWRDTLTRPEIEAARARMYLPTRWPEFGLTDTISSQHVLGALPSYAVRRVKSVVGRVTKPGKVDP